MRVLQVIDHLGLGGAQSLVVGLAELTRAYGVETAVVVLREEPQRAAVERLERSCTFVDVVRASALWDPRGLAATVRAVRRLDADVVHTHLAVADVVGGLAGRLTRTPVVATLHNVVADRLTHPRPRRALAAWATRRLARRLVAVSAAVRDSHVAELGIDPARIEVIRNAPIAPLLLPAGFDREAKRAELGLGEAPLVSVASRLAPTKDHETLIRAFAAVAGQVPAARLLIAGDGSTRGDLERLAASLGLGEHVRFLGSRPDAVELTAASDVFCNVTLALEGLPIAVLDALSLGVPLVASRVGGVLEVVEDGRGALLVPPGDVQALAAAIAGLLRNPGRARALAAEGRRALAGELDPAAWAAAHAALYRHVASVT